MGSKGVPLLAVLGVAILINAPAWVSVTVGQSLGRPALVAASQVVHLLTLVVSGLLLVPRYGALGAAIAWLAGNLIGIPVLVTSVNRYVLGYRTTTMLRESLLRPLAAASFTLLVAYLLRPIVHGWVTLGLACLGVLVFYLALAYRASLNLKDREIFKIFFSDSYQALLRTGRRIAKSQI
jgi:O-antigen/teichoic acid export membrane protein